MVSYNDKYRAVLAERKKREAQPKKKRGRPKKEPTPVEVPLVEETIEETLPEVAEESETSE
jgi:DNA invertase Pin-like site-specific DNA recombinase